jgi:putative ABC transport system permease protein
MKWDDEGNEVRRIVRLRVVGVLLESRSEADGSLIVRMDEMTAWNEWARGSRINRNKEGYQMDDRQSQ